MIWKTVFYMALVLASAYLLKLQAVNPGKCADSPPNMPALRLHPASMKTVRSHLGGLPSMTEEMKWPETPSGQPMNFIAQIDCSELPRTTGIPELPESGLLLFFFALEEKEGYFGLHPDDGCGWRVIHLESWNASHPRKAPDGIFVFKEMPVSATPEKTTPGGHAYAEHEPAASYHLMFGYPDAIQDDNMPETCADVTKTRCPGNADDWLLLLQADTDHVHSDLQFGDMGTLFFWIRKEDLAARRFDRTWMFMECY